MSVSKQEAQFLKSILAAHLDDYVEQVVREDKDKPLEKMLKNRQVGLDLISKVEETIRRAAKAGNSTYFTKPD